MLASSSHHAHPFLLSHTSTVILSFRKANAVHTSTGITICTGVNYTKTYHVSHLHPYTNIMQHNVLSPTLLHPCRTEPTSDMRTVATAIKPFHAQAPHNAISTHLRTQGQPDVTAPAGTVVTSGHHHRNKQNYIPSHFL